MGLKVGSNPLVETAQLENCSLTGCEFDCFAEQNAPHFRHFATQISACIAVFYNVKSYTNLSLMMYKIFK